MAPQLWVVGASEVPSLLGLIHLWTRSVRWTRKLAWTPVLIVPVIGPVFYVALFNGLRPNSEHASEAPPDHHVGPHDHLP